MIYTDISVEKISLVVAFGEGSMWITKGVGREVRGVMIYSSLEGCETFITRNKKPVALFELLVETDSNTTCAEKMPCYYTSDR